MKMPEMKVTKDFTKNLEEIVKRFKNDRVLVGIPDTGDGRKDSGNESQPINNATLLAINHFGIEEAHIPPRPVLSIGIRLASDEIAEQFKKAAQTTLEAGPGAVDLYYGRAGTVAANSVKHVITDQIGIQKPSAATIKTREAQGFKGTDALVVSGQLRNSITYVVRKKV